MKIISVGDALQPLPVIVIEAVLAILEAEKLEDHDKAKALCKLLGQHRAVLEKNGCVPEYLAYILVYKAAAEARIVEAIRSFPA